jgi:hypothetical protein
MEIDTDDPEKISVTFSDKTRLDDELVQLAEILAQSDRTSSSYSLAKMGYDAASKQASTVSDFMSGSFDATVNAMQSNDKGETLIDGYGIHNRRWDENTKTYSPYQSWWNANTLLFSDDGFKSAKAGIGLFTSANGEKYYGVLASVICGQLLMGNGLTITNSSGNYIINNSGFTASTRVNGTDYSVGINPNTPSEIFNIKVNGSNMFYIDTTNKKLVIIGDINATGGTISGNLNVTGTLTNGTYNSATINNGNGTFYVDAAGHLKCTSADITGYINATSGTIGGFTVDSTQLVYNGGTASKYFRISPISTMPGGSVYTTDYGAIDMGLSDDGLDTLIHICSNGYARFGLDRYSGAIRFNYTTTGSDGYPTTYGMYSKNFKIAESGIVYCEQMSSKTSMTVWGDASANFGSDGNVVMMGETIKLSGISSSSRNNFTLNNSPILTVDTVYSTDIEPIDTGHGNIEFKGTSLNAASVDYCLDHFEPKTSSDVRLKYDIKPIDIPKELFLEMKTKQFRYKTNEVDDKINFGLIAQELENLFKKYNLDINDYDLFEQTEIIKYESQGMYIKDKIHRINYRNLISLIVKVLQDVYIKVDEHEKLLKNKQ